MPDEIDKAADRIDAVMVRVVRNRIAEMGETESGAYEFYTTRAAAGAIISDYDRAIARKLCEEGLPARVHDIGGGFGSLCWLLAMLGVEATCIEHNRRRHLGAVALAEAFDMTFPSAGARLHVVKASFPRDDIDPVGTVAIATNLVFTTTAEKRDAIIAALAAYDQAIVDVDRFLDHTGPEELQAKLDGFAAAGLTAERWLHLPNRATLWRFRPAR